MTYEIRECEEQMLFCDALVRTLPRDVTAGAPTTRGRVTLLRLEGSGDLYTAVTDALRSSVPHELWTAVSSLAIDRCTAAAIQWKPIVGRR
jgi:hypothetical protein